MSTEPTRPDPGFGNQVRKELDDLKGMAAAFGPERLRDGSWFAEFIKAMLASYAEEIVRKGGVNFFRQKYPGLTQDAIAEKQSDLAVKYAALAGGLSGFTSSAAVAATIGTAGGASVVTVPAAVATIGAEILYTTRLQVRLVYDISTVYGYPIELNDPEQLYGAFALAYGAAAATGQAGVVTKTLAPEVTRAQLRGLMQGNTAVIQALAIRALGPRIGRQITQKAILKAAVPVVGVAISSGWNYVSTKQIAAIARREVRLSALTRDAARRILAGHHIMPEAVPTLAQALMAVITADGKLDPREQDVYKFAMQSLNLTQAAIDEIESQASLDTGEIEKRLRAIASDDLRQGIAEVCQLAAVVSGDVAPAESDMVQRFVTALGIAFDPAKLLAQAAYFKRGETKLEQASQAIQQSAAKTGQGLVSAGKALGSATAGLFRRKTAGVESGGTSPSAEATSSVPNPEEALRRLTVLHSSDLITDQEFEAQKDELQAAASPVADSPAGMSPAAPGASASEAHKLELSRLQALISLARVDGHVDEAEKELIEAFISGAALSDSDKGVLRSQLSGTEKPAPDFAHFQGQIEAAIGLVMDLIAVASINQKLHPAEKMYIRQVGDQLGLAKADVDEMLLGGV